VRDIFEVAEQASTGNIIRIMTKTAMVLVSRRTVLVYSSGFQAQDMMTAAAARGPMPTIKRQEVDTLTLDGRPVNGVTRAPLVGRRSR
jgi:hypothetical protein